MPNVCPYAPQCRRAEECHSPHPEPDERECFLPATPGDAWPLIERAMAQASTLSDELAEILAPAPNAALLALVDAVLAEPEREACEADEPGRARPEPIQGGLF
jgi:hypothetical protein